MNDAVNLLIVALMMFCAIGYFLAGLAMLVTRPPRIDGQTGEPSALWRAVTYTMFMLSLVNVASSFVAHNEATESWWLVAGRVLMATALVAVLIALWRRWQINKEDS